MIEASGTNSSGSLVSGAEKKADKPMKYRCLHCDAVTSGAPDNLPICPECGELMEAVESEKKG